MVCVIRKFSQSGAFQIRENFSVCPVSMALYDLVELCLRILINARYVSNFITFCPIRRILAGKRPELQKTAGNRKICWGYVSWSGELVKIINQLKNKLQKHTKLANLGLGFLGLGFFNLMFL